MSTDYQNKYVKYKNKYLNLKGGSIEQPDNKLDADCTKIYRSVDNLEYFFGNGQIINVSAPFLLTEQIKQQLLSNGVQPYTDILFYEANNFMVELEIIDPQSCQIAAYNTKALFVKAQEFCKITKIWYDVTISEHDAKENYKKLCEKYPKINKNSPIEHVNFVKAHVNSKEEWDSIVLKDNLPVIETNYQGYVLDAVIIPYHMRNFSLNDIIVAEALLQCFTYPDHCDQIYTDALTSYQEAMEE